MGGMVVNEVALNPGPDIFFLMKVLKSMSFMKKLSLSTRYAETNLYKRSLFLWKLSAVPDHFCHICLKRLKKLHIIGFESQYRIQHLNCILLLGIACYIKSPSSVTAYWQCHSAARQL